MTKRANSCGVYGRLKKLSIARDVCSGSTIEFLEEGQLLLCCGYVRELATASYPHIHSGDGDFPRIAGGVSGAQWLA